MGPRVLRLLIIVVAFFSLSLSLASPTAHADGLLVTPPGGPPGTIFQVQATGFGGGETVQLWSKYPDGRILQLGSATADGSGAASFQVSTDASFPLGTYVLAAHGTSSGLNVFGSLIVGNGGRGSAASGTGFCQGQNFTAPGFSPGERVVFSVQLPNGSVQVLGVLSADGSGNATFTLPLNPGLPTGTYVILGLGLSSGYQTSDTLNFDGTTLSGSNCSVSLGSGVPGGYVPGPIPKNIVAYRGPGVYANTDPNHLYYADCNSKWWSMNGGIYFLVLGFQPYEQVTVSYEILAIQGMTYYTTISADGYGNAIFAVNTLPMQAGHFHWWFTSKSASYCGHYDHT